MLPRTLRKVRVPALDHGLSETAAAALARFSRYLGSSFRSPATIRLYAGSVRHWLIAGGSAGHLDSELFARYLADRRRRLAPNTVNIDIKALRCFYGVQASWGDCDPMDACRLPKMTRVPARAPRFLLPSDIGEVLGSLPLDRFVGLRDYTIILTLFTTGLRASELARMTLGSLVDRCVYVAGGKGGRDRYVPFGEELDLALATYIAARGRLRPGKQSALWLRSSGQPLRSGRSVWEIVSKRVC